MRVPPLIGFGELAGHVLGHLLPVEVDARASHRHQGLSASLLLHQGDGEEISLELKVGLDPQVPLTHHNEGRNVLDPIRVQVLQLDLIVVQQTPKERLGTNHESALMEGHEGDDVAVRRRRCILTTRHKPLCRIGPPA